MSAFDSIILPVSSPAIGPMRHASRHDLRGLAGRGFVPSTGGVWITRRGRLVGTDYLIHKNVPFETSNGASELCDARKSRRETERDAKQFNPELLWPNTLEMLW